MNKKLKQFHFQPFNLRAKRFKTRKLNIYLARNCMYLPGRIQVAWVRLDPCFHWEAFDLEVKGLDPHSEIK